MNSPFTIMLVAVSMDGKISPRRPPGRPNPIGPELISEDVMARHNSMRARMDGIMVGLNCILLDDSRLTLRERGGKNPTRIVLDGLAEMPPSARVLGRDAPTIVAVTRDAPSSRVNSFREKGADVITAGRGRFVDLELLMAKLYREHGIRSLLVEGGGTVHRSMIAKGLYDEIHLIVCPFVMGGARSITPAGRAAFWPGGSVPRFDLIRNENIGDYVYLVYGPKKRNKLTS
jgi:2,5-diamino-6-(ribosylamino)-4(3H)-pyrimidinone 5'-phosphate reductase